MESEEPGEQDQQAGNAIKKKKTMKALLQKKKSIIVPAKQPGDLNQKHMMTKIMFLAELSKMHRTLREEHEAIIKLKGMCPDNKIPKGVLMKGQEAI